jgi:methylmalonyl-CoA/ethylmalonyl-CoA epimerase
MNTVIKINNFDHIGMVVKNLEQSVQGMWKNFGIGPWEIYLDETQVKDAKYYGKQSNSNMKFAMAQVGNISLGLIEPIGRDNVYEDFFKKNGEGIQHLGNYKAASEADFITIIEQLETAGFRCIWRGRIGGNHFAYVDTIKVLHTIFEVIWVDPTAPALKPSYVYPDNSNKLS